MSITTNNKINIIITAMIATVVTGCSTTATTSSPLSVANTTDYIIMDQTVINNNFSRLFDEAVNSELRKQGRSDTVRSNVTIIQTTLGDKTYSGITPIYSSALPQGLTDNNYAIYANVRAAVNDKAINENINAYGLLRAYRQPHSIILASISDEIKSYDIQGRSARHLPKNDKFTYTGKAFTDTQIGDLSYTIDFDNQSGYGFISNISNGITLHQSQIQDTVFKRGLQTHIHTKGIEGIASSPYGSSTYRLGFFGNNGEEIAGLIGGTEYKLSDITNVASQSHITNNTLGANVAFAGKRE